ncbi:MAG TPA: SRPBCC family protein, partial [Dehalococcoidia bacterium]|nr:SRPBCC family protein [Dehalococcoidia bacterium]
MVRAKTSVFETEQWFPLRPEEVFSFFSDALNLELITPPWLRFKVLTVSPIEMKEGTVIDYRLRLRGIPLRWQSQITVWEPPHRFVDQQRRGPYRLWVHE